MRTSTLRFFAVLAAVALTLFSHALPYGASWAWLALVPLLWALRTPSLGARAGLGFVYGWGVATLLSDGLVHALYFQLGLSQPLAWLVIGGPYACFLALFSAVFGALLGPLVHARLPPALQPWGEAALFTCLEWLRGHAFIGFPFALLGHTQHAQLWLIQLADLGGVYAISFVVVLVNGALATLLTGELRPRASVPMLTSVLAVLLACAAYGATSLARVREVRNAPRFRVGVVQPDASQGASEEPDARATLLWRQLEASRLARAQGARLLVWPETSLYGTLDARLPWRIEYAVGPQMDLLVGALHADANAADDRKTNSAFLAQEGFVVGRYDKRKLFPFGEYDPTRGLPWLEGKVRPLAELRRGDGPRVLSSRVGALGVLICFEALYPELSARAVRDGAELLVVMSNDAWFGDSRTNQLTAAMLTFRAVEMRRYLVRAANRGASGVVDPSGASKLHVELGPERLGLATVGLRRGLTPYARFGDLFCLLCAVGLVLPRRLRAPP